MRPKRVTSAASHPRHRGGVSTLATFFSFEVALTSLFVLMRVRRCLLWNYEIPEGGACRTYVQPRGR